MMKFEDKYNLLVEEINKGLDEYNPIIDNYQKDIYEAIRYSLLGGGKRIRPVLLLEAGEILGIERSKLMPFALAIEMIHTYSLIHDDLPALDDDEYRRGRKTNHVVYGEDIAILAGDALLTRAFEIMSLGALELDGPNGLRAIGQVAYLIGTEGMIGGQVIDLQTEGKEPSEDIVMQLYSGKTGALLKASVQVPIEINGNTNKGESKALLEYIEAIGLAFQLKDDLLDELGDPKILGKQIGRDKEKEKINFVSIYGLNFCQEYLEELTQKAVSAAKSLGEKGLFLQELAVYLLQRDK